MFQGYGESCASFGFSCWNEWSTKLKYTGIDIRTTNLYDPTYVIYEYECFTPSLW